MCFLTSFHHDRWVCSILILSLTRSKALIFVVKTDVVSVFTWAYLYPFIGAMYLSGFNTKWCLWRLPRHLKVAKTLELPGALLGFVSKEQVQ